MGSIPIPGSTAESSASGYDRNLGYLHFLKTFFLKSFMNSNPDPMSWEISSSEWTIPAKQSLSLNSSSCVYVRVFLRSCDCMTCTMSLARVISSAIDVLTTATQLEVSLSRVSKFFLFLAKGFFA